MVSQTNNLHWAHFWMENGIDSDSVEKVVSLRI